MSQDHDLTVASKTLLCRCEDVTLHDLQAALDSGHQTIEEVKRFTGLGTGPCQGKECLVPTCRLLQRARAEQPDLATRHPESSVDVVPFTVRPPVSSVTLGQLARSAEPREPGTPTR